MLRYIPAILLAAFALSACDDDRVVSHNVSVNAADECADHPKSDDCKPDLHDKR